MKVFFDSKISSIQKYGGISRMVFEMLKSLNNKKDIDKIFYRGAYVDKYDYKKEWFLKYYGFKAPLFLNNRLVNILDNVGNKFAYWLNNKPDLIYHSFYHRIPKNHKGPLVVHAYDMIQELFYNMPKASAFKKKSFEKADLIIAISQSTKNDICKMYPINPDKVVVAHLGVNNIFFNEHQFSEKTKKPYMLYVGSRLYDYKNFNLLLDTFINKKYFLDFDLILFGGEKEITEDQKNKISGVNSEKWLKQEFGDDGKLSNLYKGAAVFIYPSIYEGFGIPPLEAMASGCPVIASKSSSLPEVVGEAGLLFDPKSPEDLAIKIDRVINDKSLSNELILKGKERAKHFTWDKMTDIIYQQYMNFSSGK